MRYFVLLVAVCSASGGIVDDDHERPTSYQSIHVEHFHPVPTYIRREHTKLLEHPVSLGTSASKVEIHHGGKTDHGYAFANAENNIHRHAFGDGFESPVAGQEDALSGYYQVQDYSQYEGQADAVGHFRLNSGAQDYGNEKGVYYDNHDSR